MMPITGELVYVESLVENSCPFPIISLCFLQRANTFSRKAKKVMVKQITEAEYETTG